MIFRVHMNQISYDRQMAKVWNISLLLVVLPVFRPFWSDRHLSVRQPSAKWYSSDSAGDPLPYSNGTYDFLLICFFFNFQ